MEVLSSLVHWIDRINRRAGQVAGWIASLMVVLVVIDVILRYAFDITFVFVQELEWHLFGVLFLVGAGYTLLTDGHVRVDVLYQRFGPKTKAWINLLGVLVFLIPGCFMVIDTSWNFLHMSWAMKEGSPDPGGIPARYVLKASIPLGFGLLLLQGISMGLKSAMEIAGRPFGSEGEVRK